jgi:hypothetical protein
LSLQGVDRKSFEVINEDVAFDKNKVYHMNIDIDHDSDDDKA